MRKAFTLIELLVVIAIIAIIAAIMFPVLAQAKVSAKQTVCLSNMSQIGRALMLYQGEHDDTWVPSAYPSTLTGFAPMQMWIGYDNNNIGYYGGFYGDIRLKARNAPRPGGIDPYLQNEDIKKCPAKPDDWQMALATNWFNPNSNIYPSAYYNVNPAAAFNEFGPSVYKAEYVNGLWICKGAPGSAIDEPAQTLAAWEHESWVPMCNFLQPGNWYWSPPNDPYLTSHFHFLHRKGANALWVDGHAKRLIYGQLKRPYFSCNKSIYPNW